MGTPKALVFDFDGTIADTLPLYLDILYKGRTSSKSTLTEEEMARLRTAPLVRLVGNLEVPPFSRARLLWNRWRHMPRRMGEAQQFEGLREVLAALHKEGHRLYVMSSNYERNVRAFLRAQKLEKYFQGVYHTNVLWKARGLRRLMQREGLEKISTYYIGNEPLDMRAARRAGVRGVAVTWSGQDPQFIKAEHPEALAKRPRDLLKLFAAKQ